MEEKRDGARGGRPRPHQPASLARVLKLYPGRNDVAWRADILVRGKRYHRAVHDLFGGGDPVPDAPARSAAGGGPHSRPTAGGR